METIRRITVRPYSEGEWERFEVVLRMMGASHRPLYAIEFDRRTLLAYQATDVPGLLIEAIEETKGPFNIEGLDCVSDESLRQRIHTIILSNSF